MDELTQRLSVEQPVIVGGPNPSAQELGRRMDEIGTVFIKFTESCGGTDLGILLDSAASDTAGADFGQASGTVHVEGTLTLNDDPVRCIADIDLATLKGTGRLALAVASKATA